VALIENEKPGEYRSLVDKRVNPERPALVSYTLASALEAEVTQMY
jgi:hypothetical protein